MTITANQSATEMEPAPRRLFVDLAESAPLCIIPAAFDLAFSLGVVGCFAADHSPADPLLYEPILTRPAGRFIFARNELDQHEHHGAIVFPIRDRVGRLIDAAAWRPGAREILLYHGAAAVLGLETLAEREPGEPAIVHDSPLAFLRAARSGLFILDDVRAAAALAGETLAAGNLSAAKRLRDRLAPHAPQPPRIVISEAAIV